MKKKCRRVLVSQQNWGQCRAFCIFPTCSASPQPTHHPAPPACTFVGCTLLVDGYIDTLQSPSLCFEFQLRTPLVVEWMQGTEVQALVQKDSSCWGATKACAPPLLSVGHNWWRPCALGPVLHKRSHCDEQPLHLTKSNPLSLQLERAHVQQQRSSKTKKLIN